MPSSSSRWDRDNRQSSRPWSQRSSGGPQYPEIWNRGIRRRESTYHESSYREPEDAEPKEREAGDRDARKQVKIEAPSQQPGVKVKKDSSNDSDGSDDDENDLPMRARKPMKMIDWRGELCRILDLDLITPDDEILEELGKAEKLLEEAKLLKMGGRQADEANIRYQVVYRIRCHQTSSRPRLYLQEPWLPGNDPLSSHLRSDQPIRNFELFLEREKDISFLVYKNFQCCGGYQYDNDTPAAKSYDDPDAEIAAHFRGESLAIVADDLSDALYGLAEEALEGIPHPQFDVDWQVRKDGLSYPYLWWFHKREEIAQTMEIMDSTSRRHLDVLDGYFQERLGDSWGTVDRLTSQGRINFKFLEYLFVPDNIVISTPKGGRSGIADLQAYVSRDWLEEDYEPWPGVEEESTIVGALSCVHWTFDGNFAKKTRRVSVSVPSTRDDFAITDLSVYPQRFASDGVVAALRQRGEMLWRCRRQKYVCYNSNANDSSLGLTDQRFMIDIAVYRQMHPLDPDAITNQDELGAKRTASKDPPSSLGDGFLMCLPTSIPGFNMIKKEWVMLKLALMRDVEWNKEAFELLVADKETKELIRALIENQCDAEKNTDLISGKGNGLFILLHGAPGTGKTLTAETVAEIAEKPLYRVTCGDIGTKAEEVEKYLETVLLLGKTWGCVVLLDDADVFLEERTFFDLQRNALVSVFLRVLEYYEGILILTSNRVATFDEAFISRMQLTLRYKNLEEPQRKMVWGNLITHLEKQQDQSRQSPNESSLRKYHYQQQRPVKELEVNVEEIRRHIDELAKAQLNGRQIRNAVSTARQLAMFRGESMRSDHLKSAIEELEKFGVYLKEVKGLTEDFIQRERRVR